MITTTEMARLALAQAALQGLMSAPGADSWTPEQLAVEAWRMAEATLRVAPKTLREELRHNDTQAWEARHLSTKRYSHTAATGEVL